MTSSSPVQTMCRTFATCGLALLLFSSVGVPSAGAMQKSLPASSYDLSGQLRWTTEKWTKSDAPYRAIRLAIDKLIRSGNSPTKLSVGYASAAKSQPLDAKAQFRWAYALYRSYKNSTQTRPPILKESQSLYFVCEAMEKVAPQAREYTRLRFLLEVERLPLESYQSVARRLIASDKGDNEIAYSSIKILSLAVLGFKEALPLAQTLVKREPNNASYHAALGGLYLLMSLQRGSASGLKEKAKTEYNRYLQLTPATNVFFRQRARSLIARLDRRK